MRIVQISLGWVVLLAVITLTAFSMDVMSWIYILVLLGASFKQGLRDKRKRKEREAKSE